MADRFQSSRRATIAVALWRRFDDPGHDAARLEPRDGGWLLRGVAVFNHDGEPACLGYAVELDATWATGTAEVHGFVGRREVTHSILGVGGNWIHNGVRAEGMSQLVGIDFTPATNQQHLRRAALRVGQEVELPVGGRLSVGRSRRGRIVSDTPMSRLSLAAESGQFARHVDEGMLQPTESSVPPLWQHDRSVHNQTGGPMNTLDLFGHRPQ